ncbi:NAC domain containing protein 82 [Striga asiatica]|uniref:NAC domain containing protein 82 n=1 Tax=Striga asiatica TaxID=4170 RepID=A0A5A7QVK1_STRAF|nr:NAC domain containing protein 82 [Striga asiatica]
MESELTPRSRAFRWPSHHFRERKKTLRGNGMNVLQYVTQFSSSRVVLCNSEVNMCNLQFEVNCSIHEVGVLFVTFGDPGSLAAIGGVRIASKIRMRLQRREYVCAG